MCLLLLNTILAQGSFTLEELRQRHTQLTHQVQGLEQEVAYLSSPEVLARRARTLGMVPSDKPVFLDKQHGRVYGPEGARSEGADPDGGPEGGG